MYKLRKDEVEVMQHQLDEETKVLVSLDRRYRDSLATIDDTIAKLMGRADANLPHVIHQLKYQRALRAQVEATIDMLQTLVYEDVSKHLNQSYEDGFIGAVYSMHHQDVPLIMPIDPVQMVQAVQLDSQIKEGLHDSLNADAVRLKKTIRHEISRGIASGMLYPEISRNIHNAAGIPLRRAKMIVRTEAGRIQEKARADAAEKAKEQGADVVKQWCAVLDGKTRESHRMVDGQIRELEERFSNGLMFPKEAGGPAKEVINCRCTHLIRAKWALDEDELKQLQERAKAFGLDKTEDINDFRNKYLKAAETVEKQDVLKYNSGGLYGAYNDQNDPENKKREAHAERYYDALRNSSKQHFVKAVSKNAFMDADVVAKVYKHVFEDKHDLDKGYTYFDPDYYMAESFRRLRTNDNIQEHDVVLLNHEALEYDIMRTNPDMSYDEAHAIASETYDYKKALMAWLKKEGK